MEHLPTLSCDEKELSGEWMRMSNDLDSLIRVRRSTSGVDEWSESDVFVILLFATMLLRPQYCMSVYLLSIRSMMFK